MAVDTRNKRASALGVALAVTLTLPAPDGTVGQPDRQHAAYSYAGIEAAEENIGTVADVEVVATAVTSATVTATSVTSADLTATVVTSADLIGTI